MYDNNVIYKYQSGFQPEDSTVNQLVDIYNTILFPVFTKVKMSSSFSLIFQRHSTKYGIKVFYLNLKRTALVVNIRVDWKLFM